MSGLVILFPLPLSLHEQLSPKVREERDDIHTFHGWGVCSGPEQGIRT